MRRKCDIKFDIAEKMEYINGFQKRKNHRRKVAQKERQDQDKKKRIELRKLRRECMKEILEGDQSEEDGADQLASKENKSTQECGNCLVEMSEIDLTSNAFIGINNGLFSKEGIEKTAQNLAKKFQVIPSTSNSKTSKKSVGKLLAKRAQQKFAMVKNAKKNLKRLRKNKKVTSL